MSFEIQYSVNLSISISLHAVDCETARNELDEEFCILFIKRLAEKHRKAEI